MTDPDQAEPLLSSRLRSETRQAHEALDNAIMAARMFDSKMSYGNFLRMQHAFHGEIDPVYRDARIAEWLPDLADRGRLSDIKADGSDLAIDFKEASGTGILPSDAAERLGWLYVAEGSNLGAAFLIKEAEKLGLSKELGARHLAGHPDGRGLHWKRFQSAIDAAPLDPGEKSRVVEGARNAFKRVKRLLEQTLVA